MLLFGALAFVLLRLLIALPPAPALMLAALSLSSCGGCSSCNYKKPSVSGNPSGTSADTLCYRAVNAPLNQSLQDEVRARNLDCDAILDSDPLMDNRRY